MSNNSKKKQEEKHLKMLRELLAISSNKSCFDCNQRGPTYANTTIGSFVCISCSGKLRGLTPPHRLKSVSMASFNVEEIDFLKSRGNEYCRQVWMAHYNMADLGSEMKDDQKFKDHLAAKYEKKRWYAEPGTVASNVHVSSKPVKVMPPVVENPPINLSFSSVPRATTSAPSTVMKSSDLLADLDFFSPVTSATAFPSPRREPSFPQSISQPSFANFQNADFFFPDVSPSQPVIPPVVSNNQITSTRPMNHINGIVNPPPVESVKSNGAAPSEDRYSALKDLDALFTTQNDAASSNWTTSWNSGVSSSQKKESEFATETPSAWSAAFTPSGNPGNPFLTTSSAQPETVTYGRPALPWANFSSNLGVESAFKAPSNPPTGNNLFDFATHSNSIGVTPLSTSQSLDLSPKVWGNSAGLNPFMDTTYSQGRSHNPFL